MIASFPEDLGVARAEVVPWTGIDGAVHCGGLAGPVDTHPAPLHRAGRDEPHRAQKQLRLFGHDGADVRQNSSVPDAEDEVFSFRPDHKQASQVGQDVFGCRVRGNNHAPSFGVVFLEPVEDRRVRRQGSEAGGEFVHVLQAGIEEEQRCLSVGLQGVELRKRVRVTAWVQDKPGAPAFAQDFFKDVFGIANFSPCNRIDCFMHDISLYTRSILQNLSKYLPNINNYQVVVKEEHSLKKEATDVCSLHDFDGISR